MGNPSTRPRAPDAGGRPERRGWQARVIGDSMRPTLPPGRRVLLRAPAGPSAVAGGKIHLVRLAPGLPGLPERLLARVYRRGDRFVLRTDNPDKERFPDLRVRRRDVRSVALVWGWSADC